MATASSTTCERTFTLTLSEEEAINVAKVLGKQNGAGTYDVYYALSGVLEEAGVRY